MAKRKNPDEDQPNENDNINESDDTFGLPEIEYEPLAREKTPETTREEENLPSTSSYQPEEEPAKAPEETPQTSQYTYMQEKEEQRSSSAGIIITIVVILAAGAAWFFLYYKPKKDKERQKALEEQAERERTARIERERLDSIAAVQAREQWLADSLANAHSAVGTVEMLSDRTGKYRVVIASAIDDDLLMDYAKKLSRKGVSSKIVPPFGDTKFYRLTIAEGDSWSAAQSMADGFKSEYGDDVWVLRY